MSIMQSEEKGFFHTANAFTLNKALRNGGYDRLHPDDKKVARLLQSAIGRVGLPDNYKLYRYDRLTALHGMFGMGVRELVEEGAMNGKTVTMKQFLSTSMIEPNNLFTDRPVFWEIDAPKGVNCFTNGDVEESTILFAVGQKVKILNIYRKKDKIVIRAEMMPKGR